ncbi:MAG: ftsA [Geminicoccaceae bacterium]|jgi:cell division protein FtsA|nr:ftsA [Geminicoccaceae bacterium]MCE3249951.1 ftsA [Geminicoccaceae bacterium]
MSAAEVVQLHRGEPRSIGRHEPQGVLDVGTTKMCCLIARRQPGGGLEVLGAGYQLAEGLRAGEIVDAEAAEASILAVVHEAEQQARVTLREVVLGLSAGRPRSLRSAIEIELGGRAVIGEDVARALAHARAEAQVEGRETLHALPLQITLDRGQPLRDPRGMIGRRLRLAVHLVQVAAAPLHNLVAAVERCHLEVAAVVAAPYAAGIGSLSADELALGAIALDLGGGVTGVARFTEGRLQDIHTVPLGGRHVTQDLAFGLSTAWPQAERLKTLYGSVLARAGDAHQRLEVTGLGDPEDPPLQIVSRARLTEIIRPRVEEIFQLVRARLAETELPLAGRRLVLTGGGSTLEGVVELAEEAFGMPARIGRPLPLGGRLEIAHLPGGTTAAGLLRLANQDDGGLTLWSPRPNRVLTARLAKIGQWLRENF